MKTKAQLKARAPSVLKKRKKNSSTRNRENKNMNIMDCSSQIGDLDKLRTKYREIKIAYEKKTNMLEKEVSLLRARLESAEIKKSPSVQNIDKKEHNLIAMQKQVQDVRAELENITAQHKICKEQLKNEKMKNERETAELKRKITELETENYNLLTGITKGNKESTEEAIQEKSKMEIINDMMREKDQIIQRLKDELSDTKQ